MISFVNKYEDAFYEIKRLLYIVCSICVTSVEAEQSFSTLKLIKTQLRSTMTDCPTLQLFQFTKNGQKTEFRPCSSGPDPGGGSSRGSRTPPLQKSCTCGWTFFQHSRHSGYSPKVTTGCAQVEQASSFVRNTLS